MVHIVEAVASFDAQPAVVGGTVASFDPQNSVVLDVIRKLAADAAIRTDRIHGFVRLLEPHLGGHKRAGGTGLHTFAAGHASARTHGIGEIEHDFRMMAAEGIADHVVDLFLAAGAHTARALDASVRSEEHTSELQSPQNLA